MFPIGSKSSRFHSSSFSTLTWLLALIFAVGSLAPALAAQSTSDSSPSSSNSGSSEQQSQNSTSASSGGQQQEEPPPAAGGPQGEIGPVVVPKKGAPPPPPPPPKVKNPEGIPSSYSMQVNVPVVNVPVTVETSKGEFIPGLKAEDFKISEDGVPQKITSFSQAEAPITAVMLVEFASTYYQFLYDMLNYSYGFAESLRPNDWVAVISYDMRPTIQLDFTHDKGAVLAALNRLRIPGFSETNLFDALFDTLDRLDRLQGRKYVILITSGVDTFSRINLDTVLKKVKATPDVGIFCISTGFLLREYLDTHGMITPGQTMPGAPDYMTYLQADNELKTFSAMTGGKAYFPRFEAEMPGIVQDISQSIRNQYMIAYKPTNAKQDGSYRKIKVELVNPQTGGPIDLRVNGKKAKYSIIARQGYTAKREVE